MEEGSFPRGRGVRQEESVVEPQGDPKKRNRSSFQKRSDDNDRRSRRSDDFLFGKSSAASASDHNKGGGGSSPRKKPKTSLKAEDGGCKRAAAAVVASQSLLPLGGGGVVHPSKGPSWIEGLSFSKLAKGVKLLACVREVHEDLAVLSLPNFWTGFVLHNNKSSSSSDTDQTIQMPSCSTMLAVGQFLTVVVIKATQEHTKDGARRRIQVSCLPAAINPSGAVNLPGNNLAVPGTTVRCQVCSVEDHGILMELGAGRRGFLPFSEIGQPYTVGEDDDDDDDHDDDTDSQKLRLVEGRILDCVVRSTSNKENMVVLPLSLPSRRQMAKQMVPATLTPTLAQLKPGMLVQAKVESMVKNGLCVSFCGNLFRGAIEVQNLGSIWVPTQRQESDEWKAVFDQHRSVVARITVVDPATKMIRLSMQPHVLELQTPLRLLPDVGSIIEDAIVVRLDPGIGALLALPSNQSDDNDNDMIDVSAEPDVSKRLFKPISSDKAYLAACRVKAVYVHISKAIDKDGKEEKTPQALFSTEFAPSTKHTIRVLSNTNWVDGIASAAAARSIVHAHVLSYADVKPGKVFKQVPVCAQTDLGGVLVDLGTGVRALIPQVHLFDKSVSNDYRLKMRKVKYSVGAKVDVRVLSVDAKTKKCLLTAKKSLVKADDVIDSFDKVRVGDIGTGFVSKIDDRGLSVTFFNGVYGRVTSRSLATELGIEDHKNDYSIGDVLQCRVSNIKKRPKRGTTKFDDSDEEMEDDDDGKESSSSLYYRELTLSLKVDGAGSLVDEKGDGSSRRLSTLPVTLLAGALLPAKSMLIVQLVKGKEKPHGFVPGYAIVRIKSKYLVDEAEVANFTPYVECKLSYDQLLDHYRDEDIGSAEALDAIAETMLTAGKKINREGFVLADPEKSSAEFYSGTGKLTLVSIRPKLVETLARQIQKAGENDSDPILPSPKSSLFKGALLHGYVTHVDKRHGAFVRYLNGLTGLIPKQKGGMLVPLFRTVVTEVLAVDVTATPPKLLVAMRMRSSAKGDLPPTSLAPIKEGDIIGEAIISKLDFHRAILDIVDERVASKDKIKARVHYTMADSKPLHPASKVSAKGSSSTISNFHPFHKWEVGQKLKNLLVVSVEKRGGTYFVELTNRTKGADANNRIFFEDAAMLSSGQKVSGIVCSAVVGSGLWVEVCPGLTCHIPALEISADVSVLNNMQRYFLIGCRLDCIVLDKAAWQSKRAKFSHGKSRKTPVSKDKCQAPFLSLLGTTSTACLSKPARGDLVVGRINRSLSAIAPPALMIDLRGGFVGRCCITELEEPDEWTNMPLGRAPAAAKKSEKEGDNDDDESTTESETSSDADAVEKNSDARASDNKFPHGRFVQCRVLAGIASKPLVEVSLRASRVEGDLDDDEEPEEGAKAQAFVVSTTKKGCFLRLSQKIDGRVILKELCDGFLPNPDVAFPPGRLVVGKVKAIKHTTGKKGRPTRATVDMDMRESILLESEAKLKFEDIEIGEKYKGSVTRIEDYGVFVRIDNSDVSGLVHKSECSDKFIKNLSRLYDPGDLVKVKVLKKDSNKKQVGFSMKASHFADDDDSDEGSSVGEGESMTELVNDIPDSDDENYVSKLVKEHVKDDESEDDNDQVDAAETESSDSESQDDSSSEYDNDDDDEDEGKLSAPQAMDTDVGFDWGVEKGTEKHDHDDSEEDEAKSSESENEDGVHKSSHKSRRKQAQRRKEEQDISRRETALADGTADETPETTGDFERLLASSPNSSEIWIKYMAFHLSLADVAAAREVANRAFDRIAFREEREKLNVWCALLTLELKYGTNASALQETIDRACQQNNPKHVYLRVCEMLEKDLAASSSSDRVDEMYTKMCKKFKSKKSVWVAFLEYLLRNGRAEEAFSTSKKAMQSLPPYKHVETMSKFAQLVFEYANPERARTLFDGLLLKHPKRLDLFFVYADKEVKHGETSTARSLFERVANPNDETLKLKLSDKQMKSFFKKWYAFEEQHGTEDTQDRVKEAARQYIERSTSS